MHPFVTRVAELSRGALPKNPPTHKPLFPDCPVCQALPPGRLVPDLEEDWDEREARRAHEEDLLRHPRVRKCPGCEDAAWESRDPDAECDIHGDPYEGPFEFEFRFHELFGHFPWEEPDAARSDQMPSART